MALAAPSLLPLPLPLLLQARVDALVDDNAADGNPQDAVTASVLKAVQGATDAHQLIKQARSMMGGWCSSFDCLLLASLDRAL